MDVADQLQALKAKYKSVEVEKLIPLDFDLGNLVAYDTNPIDAAQLKKQPEAYLKDVARDGTQLLLNQIFSLPTETSLDSVTAKLPPGTTILPRAKPIPKDKPMTRWEKFAKAKGIQKTTRKKMNYDEASGEYKARWGYKGTNTAEDDWIKEVPHNADPMEDQYEKAREEKTERVNKNKQQQRRNAEEHAAVSAGKNPREVRKAEVTKKILESKGATASMGRFDKSLRNEDAVKVKRGKRKFDELTPGDASKEKEGVMNVVKKVLKGEDGKVINVTKAVKHVHQKGGLKVVDFDDGKKKKTKGRSKK
ncbi:ribosome biogenesis regulatory protein-domain-containing protein [Fimicolochytrium jonesii]|uniref:ribosome biogenesis regulatory protein-domain-containing protein n=1 Tax=Fimicolochytrium jonesii TaxID=1396493 RepID=UPI0022FE3B0C|nr:ribosome biogenesis regulatory protein-domain-containing protein [Fimicolochytrium jonesii]KAI8819217.1 ribosome biogenesis regulatory protein-domain-containing protein [Fimicolochytrium jonesii]